MTAVWEFDDGGREAAGFVGRVGDCVVRAIAIASERPYMDVYAELGSMAKTIAPAAGRARSPRDGVMPVVYKRWLRVEGWAWTPTMGIGTGATVHLRADELPAGRLIVRCAHHLVAVVDGVVRDTFDSTRDGTRCVYGFWQKPACSPLPSGVTHVNVGEVNNDTPDKEAQTR